MSEKPKEFGDADCVHYECEEAGCRINKGTGAGDGYCSIMWDGGCCKYKEKPSGGTLCVNCRNLLMVNKNPNDIMSNIWDYFCRKTKTQTKCWVTGKITNTYEFCEKVNKNGNCKGYDEKSMPWEKRYKKT